MPRARLVVFGDVIDDILVILSGPIRSDTDTPSVIRTTPGGSAANVAAWAARGGASVDFVGSVGASDVARHGSALEADGARAHLAGLTSHATGTIVVLVQGQTRDFLTQRGANSAAHPDDVSDGLLTDAAVLHLTGFSVVDSPDAAALRRLFTRAAGLGVRISVDPGSVGFIVDYGVGAFLDAIDGTSIILPSLEEGRALTGETAPFAVAAALARRFEVVALTLGSAGVIVVGPQGRPILIPAIPCVTVDPTGAGDAFCAGFLTTYSETGSVTASGRAGVRRAAQAVGTLGGRPPRQEPRLTSA